MVKTSAIMILVVMLLAACNLPSRPAGVTPTGDAVATQVSQLLTQMPSPTAAQAQPADTLTPAPAASPSVTQTSTPAAATATTAAAKPSPTTPSGDPKNALGKPTWTDTLDTGKLFHLYDNDHTRVVEDNGALVFTGIQADGWLGWSLTFSQPSQNFYLEAVMNPQTCSGSDEYGLVFRAPNTDSGYFFGVTCDGKYNLHARNFKDGSDTPLIKSGTNIAIQTGSNVTNRLGVMANGNKIGLYANGTLLEEVTDTSFPEKGYFGGLVAANNTPGFSYRMDEISLWKLP